MNHFIRKNRRSLMLLMVIALSFVLNACGGGGKGYSEPDNIVASIVVSPSTALLTDLSDTHILHAQAYNAAGEAIDSMITWVSSNPTIIEVNADGEVTNLDYVGSSSITAQSGNVSSNTATIIAIQAAINSVFVNDEQVMSAPVLVDPSIPVGLGARYSLNIDSAVQVAPGDILLGSETAPVGGRVVDVVSGVSEHVVTLELIPIYEMFTKIKIDETYHLTADDAVISDALDGLYTMEKQADGSYSFVPNLGLLPSGVSNASDKLECIRKPITKPTIPLTINMPTLMGGFKLDLNPVIQYDSDGGGLQKLGLAGTAESKIEVKATVDFAFEGKVECTLELVRVPVPLTGPLSVVLGGSIPVGVGVEFARKTHFGSNRCRN